MTAAKNSNAYSGGFLVWQAFGSGTALQEGIFHARFIEAFFA
ncbi:hypothetical protein LQ236_001718 [Nitrospina gracilis]|nr:hypothetical protein [Nitrospina sp. Nb-3]